MLVLVDDSGKFEPSLPFYQRQNVIQRCRFVAVLQFKRRASRNEGDFGIRYPGDTVQDIHQLFATASASHAVNIQNHLLSGGRAFGVFTDWTAAQ